MALGWAAAAQKAVNGPRPASQHARSGCRSPGPRRCDLRPLVEAEDRNGAPPRRRARASGRPGTARGVGKPINSGGGRGRARRPRPRRARVGAGDGLRVDLVAQVGGGGRDDPVEECSVGVDRPAARAWAGQPSCSIAGSDRDHRSTPSAPARRMRRAPAEPRCGRTSPARLPRGAFHPRSLILRGQPRKLQSMRGSASQLLGGR